MDADILKPVAALAGWTMIMWIWLYATRLPAMKRAKIDAMKMIGTTGKGLRDDLVSKGEEKASWVADNYNHLHEAPVVFYATALTLAIIGAGSVAMNVWIAWAYVGLRILHSLWQVTINGVPVRFVLFALSSLALIAQTLHTIMYVFHH
jgi:hypothetical protein